MSDGRIKDFLLRTAATAPVRALILALNWLVARVSLTWSRLRFVALVRNAHLSSACHWTTEIKEPENISIGAFVTIGPYGVLGAKSPISIGDYTRIARGVVIETGGLNFDVNPPFPHISKPIRIEEGVCILANAVILGGVTVGRYSIVGAGCVVNKDVPPFTVVTQARRIQVSRSPSVRRRLAGEGSAGPT